jgi:hypothetical protein
METGAAAMVLVRPSGPFLATLDHSMWERTLVVLARRQEDVYFRPLVQAPSLSALQWRAAKTRWLFVPENRVLTVALFALVTAKPRALPSPEDIAELYASVQRQIAESAYSEETASCLDYTAYTAMKSFATLVSGGPRKPIHRPPWKQMARLVAASTAFELYSGAALLALDEPALVKNPLVLRELARQIGRAHV